MNSFSLLRSSLALFAVVLAFGLWNHAPLYQEFAYNETEEPDLDAAAVDLAWPTPVSTPATSTIKVPIIVYHHVRPHTPKETEIQDRFDVTPELFEQHLAYLSSHGYTTISFDDLRSYITQGYVLPFLKPVILTFDDGWQNQYDYAFPLLKKYHLTATFYIYTNPLGKSLYLTWDEVKEMKNVGMNIGSHTLTHPHFKEISIGEITKEITESKQILEKNLGVEIHDFAYPFGTFNPTIENIVRTAGYLTARTIVRGLNHTHESLFHLNANLVSDNFDDFVKLLNK